MRRTSCGPQQAAVGAAVEALHHLFLDGAAGPHFLPEEEVGEGALDLGDGLPDRASAG
jgi:hypothetical protein